MKIISEREAVLDRLAQARQTHHPLFCPNAETPDEIEGVLKAAALHAEKKGAACVTLGLGITGAYPEHPQLRRLDLHSSLSADGRCEEPSPACLVDTALIWLDWIGAYARREQFSRVEIIPFLDHGWAPSDADRALMEHPEFRERMGIIMFDASQYPLEQNIKMTREYVLRCGGQVVVEACPDKILSQSELAALGEGAALQLTDPESAESFVKQTGVDLIVPSLGTEHRGRPGEHIHYRRDLAEELSRRVGSILALHGTSSLGDNLETVGKDGICKVNFYTAMAAQASQRLNAVWERSDALSVATGSGSFIHSTRRNSATETCIRMLQLLDTTSL